MASSGSNKKGHFSNLPDQLKWSKKQRNKRITRRAPVTAPRANQPLPAHQDSIRSSEANEQQKSPGGNKPTPAKAEPSLSKEKEANSSGKKKSKASISSDVVGDKPHSMPKLSLTLTRDEIEEDFFAMTGKRLPRNVKKKDKNLQKDLDALIPGLSLEGQSAETLGKRY